MKILVISGSPRGISVVAGHETKFIELPRPGGVVEPVPFDSCSERLADAFIAGAAESGHECVKKTLHRLRNISPCRACYGCVKTGKCVIRDDMQELYREFGKVWRRLPEGWRTLVLSSHTEFERTFGQQAAKKRKLYNGMIKCDVFMYGNKV